MQHPFSLAQAHAVHDPVPDAAVLVRSPPGLGRTLRDLALIALAWALLVGVIVYPVAQIVGLITCAIALVLSAARRGGNTLSLDD